MQYLTLGLLTLVAFCGADKRIPDKRGATEYSASTSSPDYESAPPSSLSYAKVQQVLQQQAAQRSVAAAEQPQAQYYTVQPQAYAQPAAAPVKYAAAPLPQQYQYEQPQAVAYAPQPTVAKYAAAPAYSAAPALTKQVAFARVPQYSLANDVSSFTYSSPLVAYNNLGLLTQITPKGAPAKVAYAQAAPAAVAYQAAPVQKLAYASPAQLTYAAAPAKFAAAPQYVTAPQQAYAQAAPQTYAAPSQAYSTGPQTFAAQAGGSQQAYAVPQALASQTLSQPIYSSAPRYYTAPQVKYAQ